MNESRVVFRLIAGAFFGLVAVSVGLARAEQALVHGQPPPTAAELLGAIVLPCAPFIDQTDDVCEVVAWLGDVVRSADASHRGVCFSCKAPPLQSPLRAHDYTARFRDIEHVTGPHIRQVRVIDFLEYLCKVRGLVWHVQEDCVVIGPAPAAE